MSAAPKSSTHPPGLEPPPARGADSLRAFVGALAGVPELAPNDPHRAAKWAGGLASLVITLIFVGNAIRGHRAARRDGYAAGRAAAERRALKPTKKATRK